MARKMPDDRLRRLVECATRVFVDQGYRRTQMADIAAALGVAKGTIYLYVESKEALFDLAVRHADAPDGLADLPTLPVPNPEAGATVRYVREMLERNQTLPELQAALARKRVGDARAELESIVGELYDVLACNRCGIKLIDRSAPDLPELAALWFGGTRGGAIVALATYLERRIRAGLIRPVPNVEVAARLIIETTIFWAVHRHWDPHPQAVEDATARETVVRFIVQALAKG
jgi:AcrR family transcriptional regulator